MKALTIASLSLLLAGPALGQSGITIAVLPGRPLIERTALGQILNFDFVIDNHTATVIDLDRIEISAFDRTDSLELRKYIAHHGSSPGIYTIPERKIGPNQSITVFNPFFTFDSTVDLARLRYQFTFATGRAGGRDTVLVDVAPLEYQPRTTLSLPTRGRTLVYDGHDFYSHHRRVDLSLPEVRAMKLIDNPVRYATDFCLVDDHNRLHRGNPDRIHEWISYGAPVYAPAAGVIILAANDVPENTVVIGTLRLPPQPPTDFMRQSVGNHLVIDHGNGEFSLLAHLKPGSITVKVGDRVERGQPVGAIGFSGDTGTHVHLHYSLLGAHGYPGGQAFPEYFSGFRRLLGSRSLAVARGPVDSGDLIDALP